ncbi:hypothetical protein [Burkholderia territorii]|uniref:Uncharacterized protein n=1 Tax=Burkholderia territorii TaxID=1503055 RepID=A0A6L3NBC2_9BURK|nr:hypothetical protein [Burkholderia territorii]KAB0655235.1 hypothetical protein F7R13_25885 [Burkholderia territorii]MBM2772917.1 hypothetical protein [Burkholderia territorii]
MTIRLDNVISPEVGGRARDGVARGSAAAMAGARMEPMKIRRSASRDKRNIPLCKDANVGWKARRSATRPAALRQQPFE